MNTPNLSLSQYFISLMYLIKSQDLAPPSETKIRDEDLFSTWPYANSVKGYSRLYFFGAGHILLCIHLSHTTAEQVETFWRAQTQLLQAGSSWTHEGGRDIFVTVEESEESNGISFRRPRFLDALHGHHSHQWTSQSRIICCQSSWIFVSIVILVGFCAVVLLRLSGYDRRPPQLWSETRAESKVKLRESLFRKKSVTAAWMFKPSTVTQISKMVEKFQKAPILKEKQTILVHKT